MNAVIARLPHSVDARVRFFAVTSLVIQILIVATGGAVRLTGSGLGCPTWPLCTDASLIATPEMGVHGVIEFGNRLLSIIVGFVAILMVLMVLRIRRERRDLMSLSLMILGGTVLQGLIGGLSVRVQLDPSIVGVHYAISAILVAISAALVYRVWTGLRGPALSVPKPVAILTHVTSLFVALTIIAGILTTGAGPHAGDDGTARNGLDAGILQHVHSWPGYALIAATLALVIVLARGGHRRIMDFAIILLVLEVVQALIGIIQSRSGLPILLVGSHMVIACTIAAAMTAVVLSLRPSVNQVERTSAEKAAL
ncbi:cytochrome c oxidase assembly protein subunit 15 [Salinibacterium amurskyense]|uniref:Cytochrome c oxidase assembly protein subunit 15 n=1 Tax=Salinibacterium amurskyense TaxID=205941 RepID=A0A2M9DA70_9MICO|nr:cytochrome c oxidase assembly protein subunit 15 [Salinibacterium amurskyense]RLQ82140.1 heme A synthase [Salinibacterium amurskyense]GHD77160.1 cytochrome b561 [Salinibacterium amurskyense]